MNIRAFVRGAMQSSSVKKWGTYYFTSLAFCYFFVLFCLLRRVSLSSRFYIPLKNSFLIAALRVRQGPFIVPRIQVYNTHLKNSKQVTKTTGYDFLNVSYIILYSFFFSFVARVPRDITPRFYSQFSRHMYSLFLVSRSIRLSFFLAYLYFYLRRYFTVYYSFHSTRAVSVSR